MSAMRSETTIAQRYEMACERLGLSLPSDASPQEALESVLDSLAPIFERLPAVGGERTGALLVVSDDAGSATAEQFWRDALDVGIAFASPGAFPWCLANAPCATIARRFGVTGPNVTWLSPLSDARAAFDAPAAWLADYLSGAADDSRPEAWLVAVHFGAPHGRLMVWHWTGADAIDASCCPLAIAASLRDVVSADWQNPRPLDAPRLVR